MSTALSQTHQGRVVATLAFSGEEKLVINIPSTGQVSDSVASLKKEVVQFLSQHMAASNLANDEVDMLEEEVSDEEGVPKKGKKGQKRKR
ncbi:hypothetical protein ABBQ32_003953 [Trebouxia sp. C0010 RCD-2024]